VRRWLSLSSSDALLLLMVFIWGANYSVIKAALREIPPQAFNAARMAVASAAIAAALAWTGIPRMPRRDWLRLAAIGTAGHFIYQVFFMSGIARTSVSNSSLIIGCSPVAVSIASALAGHERIARPQWAGILLSLTGVYLVVGLGAGFGGASLAGDLFTMGAVGCWAVYTVGARALLTRYSPLTVTGLTMIAGTSLLVSVSLPDVMGVDWGRVPAWAWAALVLSALLAIDLAYLIWYTSVQRIGNVRTSAYSNFIPLVAMAVAVVVLGESLTAPKIAGAAAILSGVAITRVAGRRRMPADPPGEE